MSLTLPGTLPGLLRLGSPVWAILPQRVLVVSELGTGTVPTALCGPHWYMLTELALDLEDETGRAHAAWWLAEQMAIDAPGPWMHAHSGRWGFRADKKRWSRRVTCTNGVAVPALADLDPNGPRLLPDGSRWVDAEALRLVCLHVGGVA